MQKEKNIKILHIITRLIVGGAQENVLFRTKYLAQNGFDVYLVSGPTSGPEGHIPLEGIKDKVKFFIIPELVREIILISFIRIHQKQVCLAGWLRSSRKSPS